MAESAVVAATKAVHSWLRCRDPVVQEQAWHGLAGLSTELEWRQGLWPIDELGRLLDKVPAAAASGVLHQEERAAVQRLKDASSDAERAYEIHHLRRACSALVPPYEDLWRDGKPWRRGVFDEDDLHALPGLASALGEVAEDADLLRSTESQVVNLFHAAYHALWICGLEASATELARRRRAEMLRQLDRSWPAALGVVPMTTCTSEYAEDHARERWAELPLLQIDALLAAWPIEPSQVPDAVAAGMAPAWAYVVASLDHLDEQYRRYVRLHDDVPPCMRCVRTRLVDLVHARPVSLAADEDPRMREHLAQHAVDRMAGQFTFEYYKRGPTSTLKDHYSELTDAQKRCIRNYHQLIAAVSQASMPMQTTGRA